MNQDSPEEVKRKLAELKKQMESLESVDTVVKPVVAYWEKLSSISRDQQNDQQKLWLLAYGAINVKMAPGTEASLVEAAKLLPILYNTIPTEN